MCRLAAYIGDDPRPLSSLLYDPPHSLEHASYKARELIHGNVNVDGSGVAWWADISGAPLRYATDKPTWGDENLMGLARRLSGNPILAAVRGATPGIGHGSAHVAPFTSGFLAGVHNGWVGDFRGPTGRDLVSELSDDGFSRLSVMNDSRVIFLMVVDRVEAGMSPTDALADVVQTVAKITTSRGKTSTLNLVIASADEVAAAKTSVNESVNSLYTLDKDGFWLASEPLDDADPWQPVADHTLVTITRSGIETAPLQHVGVA